MANYNGAEFIEQAIQSVLNQTYKNWELIIVDDASTDGSIDIISKIKDSRILLIKRDTNYGYGRSLQIAAANVTGDIIGILDSDDALRFDTLKIMKKAYEENLDCGLIYSQHFVCDENLDIISREGKCGELPENMTYLDVLQDKSQRTRVSHFKTFRKSVYRKTEGFTDHRRAVDKDIILKLEEVTKLEFIDLCLYYYRKHSKGISINPSSIYNQFAIDDAKERRGL